MLKLVYTGVDKGNVECECLVCLWIEGVKCPVLCELEEKEWH